MLATATQSESDLKLVTAMLDEEMDMQMGTLSVPTLLALGDAVVAKRPVAFFPAGIVLAAAEVSPGSVTPIHQICSVLLRCNVTPELM